MRVNLINDRVFLVNMANADIACMHQDLEILKQDIAIIKHILSEEGELTKEAKIRLAKARQTPDSEYLRL